MTIVGPVLMAALVILPVYLSENSSPTAKIAVLDETGWFYQKFHSQGKVQFYYVDESLDKAKAEALSQGSMLLYIPMTRLNLPENAELFSQKQPGIFVENYIKTVMKQVVEDKKMLAKGIDPNVLKSVKAHIHLVTIKISEKGIEKKTNTDVETGLAIFSGFLIYLFVFMYGAQVMRGVMEEKQNRIVELIVSSVKPFQLMAGKIIGVGLVGLTQFLLWVVLTMGFVGVFQSHIFSEKTTHQTKILTEQTTAFPSTSTSTQSLEHPDATLTTISGFLSAVNFKVMILSFIFYFLGGYLLYASLYAAVAGAIDHDADAQQFTLPISIPLIFSMVMVGVIANQPDGPLALWMSMIPFTSPVIMMMRIPFGVPYWQIGLSAAILILTFLLTTFLAGKIYRIGILIYGKKVGYSDLWKWIRY